MVDTRRSHEDRTLCIEFLGKAKGEGNEKGRRRGRERERERKWRLGEKGKEGGENVIDIVNSGWKIEKGKEGISERERKEFYRGSEILGLERNWREKLKSKRVEGDSWKFRNEGICWGGETIK